MGASDDGGSDAQRTAAQKRGKAILAGTPYRFVAPLGHGGMGEVVEAEHIALGKRVVVKLIHAQLAKRPDLVDRMRVEAQALGRLEHPNLVAVTDFGKTSDGRPFLVMERLVGRTVREELRARGAFPVAEAIDIGRQALAALGAAHEIGIVHRDVKLDNLFLCDPSPAQGAGASTPFRRVKLLDFGIAKVVSDGQGRAPAPLAFPTEEGIAVGTPRFFSPEQARGEKVDARTDIYAVGIVLYTLVAGRGPFDHINALFELTRAHASEVPPPPSKYAPWPVPRALDDAIMKAIEKRPADRWQSAAEFAAALGAIAESLGKTGPASHPATSAASPAALMPGTGARGTVRMDSPLAAAPSGDRPSVPAPLIQAAPPVLDAPPPAESAARNAPTAISKRKKRTASSFVAFAIVIVASALLSAALVALLLSGLGK